MSDYFSLGQRNDSGGNSPGLVANDHGDAASTKSGDSYLLNISPSDHTLVDSHPAHSYQYQQQYQQQIPQYPQQQHGQSQPMGQYQHHHQKAPSTISGISAMDDLSQSAAIRDSVLPKTDPKSPYFVNVPIPVSGSQEAAFATSAATGAATGPGTPSEEDDQFVREYPTDILMDRFYKWRKILKGLIIYLREVAYSQEQFARINFQLKGSVKFPFLTDIEDSTNKLFDPLSAKGPAKKQQPVTLAQKKQQQQQQQQQQLPNEVENRPGFNESGLNVSEYTFQAVKTAESDESSAASGFMKFGSGSVQDIQVILKKYHLSLANQQLKVSKEITGTMIPKMEDLRKDLQLKIKEIKELHGDFKTNINEHVAITGQFLTKYIASVRYMNTATFDGSESIKLNKKGNQLKPKHDPYLLKLQLDLQLKRQLLEENYLQEAFINLQTSGMELEKIVYARIQHTLQKYCLLIDSEARLMIKNLCRELQQGMLSRPPALEWDHFVSHHPACLINWKSTDPIPVPRKLSDIIYPQMKSSLAKCIRAGYLSKKSKYLKNYNKGYFVLTSNYLHEFKSSNFFKASVNSPGEAKDHQNVPIASQNTAKTSLVPIMSISLNDCILTEASDSKFVIVGKPTFNDLDLSKIGTSAKTNLSSMSSTNHVHTLQEAPKKLTKSTIGKLLKGGKSKTSSHIPKKEDSEEVQEFYAAAQKEVDKTVNWVFKPASSNPTPEDIKQFKKWAHDLKNLTTFNDTKERSRFIEERILKTQSRVRGNLSKTSTSSISLPAMNDFSTPNTNASSFRKERPGRPQYIQLQNSSSLDFAHGSRVNTPAVDDNGNLITVAERRYIPSTLSMTSPGIASPHSFNSNSNSEGSSSRNSLLNASQQFQQQTPLSNNSTNEPVSGIVGHDMIPNTAPVVSGTPVNNLRHKRNVSQTHSLGGMSAPPAPLSNISSPKSVHSEGSMGGYFSIPVKPHSASQGSTPLYTDDSQGQQNSISTNPSRTSNLGMRSASGGYSPQQLGIMNQVSSSVPRFKLNDQDVHHHDNQQGDVSAQKFKKNATAGALPAVKVEGNLNGGNSLYMRSNHSANSLTSNPTRMHPIRKHKKNVSFSSLNSLMFSKKATPGGTHMTDQFMSGGIQEDDDDHDSQSIKLNQSIYS
ncbi:hypothetical protein HG535_0B06050 [Zygotorulaspora mrakii]|uniref:PH domain-containing protein n=1 Tax=Zygotorulaspora mrakii TaxID=42260 RepID=A0A7H9AZ12_ZYGMR|nr:uncharacterized protein HG535_0B06050 [Zygotorulaspora mrakii]QLG71561.1 hypothetical protein HG535_0B06050 [Zygotorulaspora mrakii]